jgi:AhpD family alkylhydroperoxidase
VNGLQHVEWETCVLEPRHDPDLDREIRKTVGFIPEWLPYFTPCPWLVRAQLAIMNAGHVAIDFDLDEMVSLVVGQDNSCRYCYAMHRTFMRALGHSDADIRRIEDALANAELEPKTAALLNFVRRVSHANPLAQREEMQRVLDAGVPRDVLREAVGVAAFQIFLNRVTTLPAIPVANIERLAERPIVRLMSPILGRVLRWKMGPRKRAIDAPRDPDAPFDALIGAFSGLPCAVVLRGTIDAALGSPLLPLQLKLLAMAVIARALDCTRGEKEVTRMLARHGVDPSLAEAARMHLHSDALPERENLALRYARESVRYTPAAIQRYSRDLRRSFAEAELVELIGVVSLANAVCRIAVMIEP